MTTAINPRALRIIHLLLIMALFCPFARANTVQWPVSEGGNGHVYEVVLVPGGITWIDANNMAEQKGGHLATITSQNENDFVFSLINDGQYWNGSGGPLLGAYQLPGSVEPDGGWVWVTGEPFVYSNWRYDQPNNLGNENCIHFGWGSGITPTWNDLSDIYMANSTPIAYVVEYSNRIIYVDDDADVSGDGTSWTDAYVCLQDALAAARSGDEIRVAQGIYKPDERVVTTPRTGSQLVASGDRTATFQLINWVTIKGGYAGYRVPNPNARDIELFETILSGDLNGDDRPNLINNSENSYHVVTDNGTNEKVVLEGFTITGGHANGPALYDRGSGMLNYQSSSTVTNCIFIKNFSESGGAMYNDNSSPTLTNCMFTGNAADRGGGAMTNWQSSTMQRNCTFSNNSAGWSGGAIDNHNNLTVNSPTLFNCTFIDNAARGNGGGMFNDCSSPTLTHCIFSCNWADMGGGMANTNNSGSTIINCTFTGNRAINGGGMYCEAYNKIALTNCTFSGNLAKKRGGAIYQESGYLPLTNCILWGNMPMDFQYLFSASYSNVPPIGLMGEANISTDPLFVNPGYWDPNETPDDPNDDFWVDGDYHLKSKAGRWDSNNQSWIKDDITSPCIDCGDPNSSVGDEPMPNGNRINMGAYGGTPEASISSQDINSVPNPYKASNPNPANGTFINGYSLSWTVGLNAFSHDVYFGPNIPPKFILNQTETEFDTASLRPGVTYFWRIVEVDGQGNKTIGDLWRFNTIPPKGRTCFPGNTSVWVDGTIVQISKVAAGQTAATVACQASVITQIEKVEEHEGTFTCYDISLESGNCLSVAENHYFLVESGQWIPLQNLKVGAKLRTSKGTIRITNISRRPIPYVGKIFNLKIDGSDLYLVGEDAIVVRDY